MNLSLKPPWRHVFFTIINPFSVGILRKIANKKKQTKNPTLNGYISKTRANSESKLKFSESSFKFLQNSVLFCTLYPREYTAGGSAPLQPPVPLSAARGVQRFKSYNQIFITQNLLL